jgi:hypothetical protein
MKNISGHLNGPSLVYHAPYYKVLQCHNPHTHGTAKEFRQALNFCRIKPGEHGFKLGKRVSGVFCLSSFLKINRGCPVLVRKRAYRLPSKKGIPGCFFAAFYAFKQEEYSGLSILNILLKGSQGLRHFLKKVYIMRLA